jgi:hypothetical protein
MLKSVLNIKNNNPRFKHYLFDDNDCREFIKSNFKPDVLNAYDRLIPGAYKADLWRYCILFIHGGIYLDIKYTCLNGFKFINLTESEHFVEDVDGHSIYNALMVCKPKNDILYKAIRQIVENVNTNFYGNNSLEPTGPGLLCKFISTSDNLVDLRHDLLYGDMNYRLIYYKDIPVIKSYHGNFVEKNKSSITANYAVLWDQKNIYL